MFLLLSSSPGSSELNEQRSRALQVDLIDRVVFVRILVVPTTSSADSLPLAVNLRTEAETQTWIFKIKVHTHTQKQTYNAWRCVDDRPVWFEWKDSGSWRRWTCIQSKPVKGNRTGSLWKNRKTMQPAENKSSKNKRKMYSKKKNKRYFKLNTSCFFVNSNFVRQSETLWNRSC